MSSRSPGSGADSNLDTGKTEIGKDVTLEADAKIVGLVGREDFKNLNDQQNTYDSAETGTVIRFFDDWSERLFGLFNHSFNVGSPKDRSSSTKSSNSASWEKFQSLNAKTNEFIVKQREEEVPLEFFISNPFLLSVCHLRALLNQYRDD